MIVKKGKLFSLLSDAFFPLLFAVAGGILVSESSRITASYNPKIWITGPSGFMMIIGLLLLFFALLEVIKFTVKLLKLRMGKVETYNTNTPKTIEDEKLTADKINNYETAEEEQTGNNRKISRLKMFISFGLLIVYTVLVKPLGFSIASTLYIGANLRILNNSWKSTIITSVIILIALLFGAPAMGLSLPRGIFGI